MFQSSPCFVLVILSLIFIQVVNNGYIFLYRKPEIVGFAEVVRGLYPNHPTVLNQSENAGLVLYTMI